MSAAPCLHDELTATYRLLDDGDNAGAVERFRQLVAHYPHHPDPHVGLGAAFLWSGQLTGGVQAMRTALRLCPGHPVAGKVLSRHLGSPRPPSDRLLSGIEAFRDGDFVTAAHVARAELEDSPDDVPALRLLAHSQLKRGEREDGAEMLATLVRLSPDSRDVLALADLLTALGRHRDAAAARAKLSPPPDGTLAVALTGTPGVTAPVWVPVPPDGIETDSYIVAAQ